MRDEMTPALYSSSEICDLSRPLSPTEELLRIGRAGHFVNNVRRDDPCVILLVRDAWFVMYGKRVGGTPRFQRHTYFV
ncbi:hypothetical protein JTE90_004520 [Oedothorax gibbosus]|uniref:Uncharacterized protein n=1 Tax=Oedothorax gibbosus TaxID=931172 RepID=A0AAV6VDZ8_9ARAC|nr:hypothetical protein JTE90_004520 [Oedothorax gibbosus]